MYSRALSISTLEAEYLLPILFTTFEDTKDAISNAIKGFILSIEKVLLTAIIFGKDSVLQFNFTSSFIVSKF